MNRRTSLLILPVALLVGLTSGVRATQAPQTVREVDAATFLLTFRTGSVNAYTGYRVRGVATDFHGIQTSGGGTNTHQPSALSTPQPSVVLTIGAIQSNAAPKLLTAWEDWRAADRDATTLDVLLRLPSVPAASDRKFPPATYEFSGMYLGEQTTVERLTPGGKADSSGCRQHDGAHLPRTHVDGHGLVPGYPHHYCVPVLTQATIK